MVDRNVAERLSSNGAFALELEGVGRQFGALVALADINLRVQAGQGTQFLARMAPERRRYSTRSLATFRRRQGALASLARM